jgi:hypothetical protein
VSSNKKLAIFHRMHMLTIFKTFSYIQTLIMAHCSLVVSIGERIGMRNLLKLAGIALLLGHACQDAAVLASAQPKWVGWTLAEDAQLRQLVAVFGTDNWDNVAYRMLRKNTRQCRERWMNYLNPSVNKGPWSREEENLLLQKLGQYGLKWKIITQFFHGRTCVNVKSHWFAMKGRAARAQQAMLQQPPQQLPQQPPLGDVDHTLLDVNDGTGLFGDYEQGDYKQVDWWESWTSTPD